MARLLDSDVLMPTQWNDFASHGMLSNKVGQARSAHCTSLTYSCCSWG